MTEDEMVGWHHRLNGHAAAKSLQSCPTLCDPIDGSPPGSSVHGDSPDEYWVFIGRTDVEAETPILCPPDAKR